MASLYLNDVVKTEDLTMRTSQSGEGVISTRSEYICNVMNMLFNMIPGTDEYNSSMGLNVGAKRFQQYVSGERDTEYEADIKKQIGLYTNMIPTSVIASYADKRLTIFMIIQFNNDSYNVSVSTDNSLQSVVMAERANNL